MELTPKERAGNSRTFIAAGCEVPAATPPENVKAVYEALLGIAGD